MKKVAKIVSTVILIFSLPACANLDNGKKEYFSPSYLNNNSEKFDGKSVSVRGYLLLGTNGRSLYESRAQFKSFSEAMDRNDDNFNPTEYDKYCLTLIDADIIVDNAEKLRGKTVTLSGVFVKSYNDGSILDLQACGRSALAVDQEDAKRLVKSLR